MCYLAFAERAGPELRGATLTEGLRKTDPEADNLRAMLTWIADHQEFRLAARVVVALAHRWRARAEMPDVPVIERLMQQTQPDERAHGADPEAANPARPEAAADVAHALAIAMQATVFFFNIDWREISPEARRPLLAQSATVADPRLTRALAQMEDALAILRAAGDVPTLLLGLPFFGIVMYEMGDEQRGAALMEEGLALARQVGDHRNEGAALGNMEELAFAQCDYARAAELHAQSLPHIEASGDETQLAFGKVREAYLLWARGDAAGAAARAQAGLEQAHRVGYFVGVAEGLEALAIMLADLGQAEHGTRALGAAESLRASKAQGMGRSPRPSRLQLIEPAIARLRAALGDDGYAEAFAAGRALPLDEAVAEALAEAHLPVAASDPGGTT
jgi:hypothetical protein